jgi:very-short-patch-repair endonuclease
MTLPEKVLAKALRKAGLHVRRQAPVGRYIADFAFHSAALIVEVDGFRHDLPDAQIHDAERDAWLRSQGYRVLRFRNQHVLDDPDGVVGIIMNSLPPRWGKGRDGGACTATTGKPAEAVQPPGFLPETIARTPTQPSPIEGEGS